MINYWPFEGNLIDLVGGKDMKMGQSASFTNDRNEKSSSALDLKVGNVQVPDGVYFYGDFTITSWIMLRKVSNWAKILYFSSVQDFDSVWLAFTNDISRRVVIAVDNLNASLHNSAKQPLELNNWYFLSVVLKDSIAKIYYNTTLQCAGKSYSPRNVTRRINHIGTSSYGEPSADAKIDELKFFERALNETEIMKEMLAN